MSVNQKCPSCGGHKPSLMACVDCGFKYTVVSRPPAATKPVSSAPVESSIPRSEYRAVMEERGANKPKVVIKTKKRRVYTLPTEE